MQISTNTNQSAEIQSRKKKRFIRNFVFHLHPPKVPKASIQFNRTFGLGGMAVLLFLIQVLSGLMLRFVYIPLPEKAYDSIIYLQEGIFFGSFIRNIHHWSGVLFVVIAFLHFVRVFYSQAFYAQRRVNWIIGIILLMLAVLSNFTGYLLPWDQLSYWAVTVATNMLAYVPFVGEKVLSLIRGGNDVGSSTLLNFYNFHTGILPLLMAMLMVWHFWRVRKAKGVAIPDYVKSKRVPSYPDFILKEFVVALILIAVISMLSVFFDAPLQDRANPAFSPNPAKAPWYFMGIQELLLHIHPVFAFLVLPLFFFGGLIWVPYAFKSGNEGVWFHSEKGKTLAIQAGILALILTPLTIVLEEFLLHFENWLPNIPGGISEGLIPFLLLTFSFGAYILLLRKKYKADRNEIVVAIFTVFVVAYIVLTITGVWFRGESMHLDWPWKI